MWKKGDDQNNFLDKFTSTSVLFTIFSASNAIPKMLYMYFKDFDTWGRQKLDVLK